MNQKRNLTLSLFLNLFLIMSVVIGSLIGLGAGAAQKTATEIDFLSLCRFDNEAIAAIEAGELQLSSEQKKCFMIETVEMQRLDFDLGGERPSSTPVRPSDTELLLPEPYRHAPISKDRANSVGDLATIVNIGKSVWEIIKANQPVVQVESDAGTATPLGIEHWGQLEGWQVPRHQFHRLSFRNGFGVRVVELVYRVHYTYGGSIEGAGQYLTHLTVVPSEIKVLSGFKLDLRASVPNVINVGSRENPIGAAEFMVRWSLSSVLINRQGSENFFVRGDGRFQVLHSLDFDNPFEDPKPSDLF
jgi:hypothetical protein